MRNNILTHILGGVYMGKNVGQPGASVSWNDLNFRLHENICFGLQG